MQIERSQATITQVGETGFRVVMEEMFTTKGAGGILAVWLSVDGIPDKRRAMSLLIKGQPRNSEVSLASTKLDIPWWMSKMLLVSRESYERKQQRQGVSPSESE